jgi:hypothetical protein
MVWLCYPRAFHITGIPPHGIGQLPFSYFCRYYIGAIGILLGVHGNPVANRRICSHYNMVGRNDKAVIFSACPGNFISVGIRLNLTYHTDNSIGQAFQVLRDMELPLVIEADSTANILTAVKIWHEKYPFHYHLNWYSMNPGNRSYPIPNPELDKKKRLPNGSLFLCIRNLIPVLL